MNKNSLGWSSLLMQFSPINFIGFGTQKLHCLKIYLTAIQRKTWTNLQFQIQFGNSELEHVKYNKRRRKKNRNLDHWTN